MCGWLTYIAILLEVECRRLLAGSQLAIRPEKNRNSSSLCHQLPFIDVHLQNAVLSHTSGIYIDRQHMASFLLSSALCNVLQARPVDGWGDDFSCVIPEKHHQHIHHQGHRRTVSVVFNMLLDYPLHFPSGVVTTWQLKAFGRKRGRKTSLEAFCWQCKYLVKVSVSMLIILGEHFPTISGISVSYVKSFVDFRVKWSICTSQSKRYLPDLVLVWKLIDHVSQKMINTETGLSTWVMRLKSNDIYVDAQ